MAASNTDEEEATAALVALSIASHQDNSSSNNNNNNGTTTNDGLQQQVVQYHQQERNNNGDADSTYDWLSLVPSIVQARHLECQEQTIESAQDLLKRGLLGHFTQEAKASKHYLSTQVEASLLESFLENDYDGALHLTTLNNSQGDQQHQQRPVGMVFWRELSKEEMREWIHWENLRKKLVGEQQQQQQHREIASHQNQVEESVNSNNQYQNDQRRMRQSLRLARRESIRWLDMAATAASALTEQEKPPPPSSPSSPTNMTNSLVRTPTNTMLETLTHSWVKIELLAVHPDYWGQRIGSLLLASAMYQAYRHGDEHMILHVAGGRENVPALRLYDKFGFVSVPEGTLFHKPDRDLFVLGNVKQSLKRLCWPALEHNLLCNSTTPTSHAATNTIASEASNAT